MSVKSKDFIDKILAASSEAMCGAVVTVLQ